MRIFDAHMHFWDLSLKKNPWLFSDNKAGSFIGDYTSICQDYFPDDFLHDAADFEIIGAVHVQAAWDNADSVGETQWLNDLRQATGLPMVLVGHADLTMEAKAIEAVLAGHCQYANFRSIRQIINWHENPYFSGCARDFTADPAFAKGFALLKHFDLAFDLQAYPAQLETLLPLFQQHDDIPIIIEHCGMPLFLQAEDVNRWQQALQRAAALPHTVIKLSGIGMFSHHSPEFMPNRDILQFCLDTFGVERCLYGSNFPVDKLYGGYGDTVQLVLDLGLSEQEQQFIFEDNTKRVYRYEN